jgi:formylglycine-generating enzyme required for sulfatase activity
MRQSNQVHVNDGAVSGDSAFPSCSDHAKLQDSQLGYVDQFRLIRKFAQGSYGPMYVAEDMVTGRPLIIYVLPGAISNNSVDFEHFRKSMALQHDLLHPHISNILYLYQVQVVNAGLSSDLRVFSGDYLAAMEYAPGGQTLSEWRETFPGGIVPVGLALYVCRQLAAALDFAHAKNIVHRELKPGNVLIENTSSGLVARALNFAVEAEIRSCLNRTSIVLGISAQVRPYMAPAQWQGQHQDSSVDQYALAVMFYEMVSGEVPFASIFETSDPSLMAHVVEEKLPAPIAELSEAQNAALQKALSKDPALRFPSCGALIEKLQEQSRGNRHRRGGLLLVVLLLLCAAYVGFQKWQKCSYFALQRRFQKAVLVDEVLLQEYGGEKWNEVERLAKLGAESSGATMAGRRAYARALALLPVAVLEARANQERLIGLDLPRLQVSVMLDGFTVTDAEVHFEPPCRRDGGVYILQPGQTYVVYVSMPPDSGRCCNVVEYRVTADWQGTHTWSAELGRVSMRIPPGFSAVEGTVPEPYSGTGWAKEVFHEPSGITLVFVPAGNFMMGSPLSEEGRYERESQRAVHIESGFYLGKTEVTQEQWEKVMLSNPAWFKESGPKGPVENVSWEDCQAFCQALGLGFCLPSEAQWEYACRAGGETVFHFGNQLDAEMANFDGRYPYGGASEGKYRERTVPSCEFSANAWGLYDMHGNVWEWCSDDLNKHAVEQNEDRQTDDLQMKKVTRGGGWNSEGRYCRAAYREGSPPGLRINGLGLRVCYQIPVQ